MTEEVIIKALKEGAYGIASLGTLIWVLVFVLKKIATRLDSIGDTLKEILDGFRRFNGKKSG